MTRFLREAHAHIAQHGRAMSMERLESCRSLDECLQQVARAAAAAPPGSWILGAGLRIESWREARWPTLAELDSASGDRPVCLWSFDFHALIVNTPAMRRLDISTNTPDPENGRIIRDDRARPTGVMLEAAAKMVWSRIPEPTEEERRRQVLGALRDLASHGFNEVHDLLAPLWLGPLLRRLSDEGLNPIQSIWLYVPFADLHAAAATVRDWETPRLRLAGAKVFVDGTLNSRTALMLSDYADPLPGLPRGQAMMSHDDLVAAFRATHRWLGSKGHLAAHAIGDGAVRLVLDAVERASPERDEHGVRARIEHAEIIDAADVARIDRLGVIASLQPCHLLADIEALHRYLPHRLDRVFPIRELLDAGCRPGAREPHRRCNSGCGEVWFGSDAPIVRPDPEDSIQAAVYRRRPETGPAETIAPNQAITEAEAWGCFGHTAG